MFEIDGGGRLGDVAAVFVGGAFLFKYRVPRRIVNSIGAALFVIYALITQTYPVALLNAFLVVVHIYQLWRLKTASKITHVK